MIERLQQITTKNAVKSAVTADTLMAEFEQTRAGAMESKQFSAAVKATTEKRLLSGHRVERREVGTPGEFDHLTDDELERAIRDLVVQLGCISDAGTQH